MRLRRVAHLRQLPRILLRPEARPRRESLDHVQRGVDRSRREPRAVARVGGEGAPQRHDGPDVRGAPLPRRDWDELGRRHVHDRQPGGLGGDLQTGPHGKGGFPRPPREPSLVFAAGVAARRPGKPPRGRRCSKPRKRCRASSCRPFGFLQKDGAVGERHRLRRDRRPLRPVRWTTIRRRPDHERDLPRGAREGEWQVSGACFPFRAGFECGIVRLAWGSTDPYSWE